MGEGKLKEIGCSSRGMYICGSADILKLGEIFEQKAYYTNSQYPFTLHGWIMKGHK